MTAPSVSIEITTAIVLNVAENEAGTEERS
jgi:hypothetical protein